MPNNIALQRIIIIGAGGHARSVASLLGDLGHEVIGFLDDDERLYHTTVAGYRVLGPPAMVQELALDGAIVAIGDNQARRLQFEQLERWGIPLINAVHPRAYLARDVSLGRGIVVMAMATINTGARIGDNAIISLHAVVSHEAIMEAHTHVAANACLCGRVILREGAFVGAGATVIPCQQIGRYTTIGAGATVIDDIPEGVIAAGVPARVIKQL